MTPQGGVVSEKGHVAKRQLRRVVAIKIPSVIPEGTPTIILNERH
jgi:hypothetical protein